jgi:hypothetical protein
MTSMGWVADRLLSADKSNKSDISQLQAGKAPPNNLFGFAGSSNQTSNGLGFIIGSYD